MLQTKADNPDCYRSEVLPIEIVCANFLQNTIGKTYIKGMILANSAQEPQATSSGLLNPRRQAQNRFNNVNWQHLGLRFLTLDLIFRSFSFAHVSSYGRTPRTPYYLPQKYCTALITDY